ncbi:MAG: aminotransferase class I/II-fold pyridoxal phosphate-dependent enzyme [Bacteroidia bacterium]|nr:aminotransferase class I/II-fold pyridoxal phosphate-dependent enzyme [Bacteroidia bacterium]
MKLSESPDNMPFDPEAFRKEGHLLIDTLANYLKKAYSDNEMAVLPWNAPEDMVSRFEFESGGGEKEPLKDFVKRIIDSSNHLHNPRYIGHQVTSPLPMTALITLCTSLLNNGAAIYEMGPVAMGMEKNIIERFGSMIGYKEGYDGVFTHGGTAGNLTAMLAARQVMTGYNIWEDGIREKEKPGFIVSDQSHYSIGRNIKIMGLGADSVVRIPVDSGFRMRTDLLEDILTGASEKGIKVISVIASACSTATGSYDNLEAIAEFCEKHRLWMHVDGAHGMGVLFSDKYRHLIRGIERADSVIIDFHKMLLTPALNTLIVFKKGETSYETFSQKASYLFNKTEKNVWYNSATRTLECTKSSLGIIAYTAMKYYGNKYFSEYIDSRYDLASLFAGIIESDSQMELATEPESNIVCFRYSPGLTDNNLLNKINAAIRDIIIKEGSFYIVQTELSGIIWLRTTIINPNTSFDNLMKLLERVKDIGVKLMAG